MTIDAHVAPASPAPVQKTGGGAARQRAPDEASGGASFLSLLQAQQHPVADPAVAMAAGDAATQPDPPGAQDATDVPVLTDLPAVPVAPAAPPAAAAPARARPGAGAADAATTVDVSADAGAGADGTAALADTDPAQAAALRAANAASRNASATPGEVDAQARQQNAEALATARDAAARVEPSAKEADATQWRTQMASPAGSSATAVVSMFEAGLAGLRGGPGARTHERGAARTHVSEVTGTGFVPWSDATPGSSAPQAASPVYAPTVAAPVLSAALAQKMHYWVAGGVQSAELQLDAFGGGAVDVRIAVKGDEAFVEFRSDQAQARKLLLDAMPQLKELLAGEGLMLSGGFVGDSAQDQAPGARSGRPAGMRSASVPVQEVSVPSGAPAHKVSGQAVDLFV